MAMIEGNKLIENKIFWRSLTLENDNIIQISCQLLQLHQFKAI
jgi:hypothetical protein